MGITNGELQNCAAGDQDALTQLVTYYAGAKLRLFQSSLVPDYDTPESAFVAAEATFTGYPATGTVLTYSALGIGQDGKPYVVSSRVFDQATDAVHPNNIGGFWVETAAGVLVTYVQFATPVDLTEALKFVALTLTLTMPLIGSYVLET